MNSQYMFINSADRMQGTPSNFLIDIQDIDTSAERDGIVIQNLIIPNNYQNINSFNNVISLGTSGDLTIPVGNYTPTSFVNYFNTNNGLGITATYDSTNCLMNYACGTTFSIVPTTKQKYLGLLPSESYIGVTSIAGNRIADYSGSTFFDVMLDGLQLYSANTRDYNRNIFARVFNTASYGEFQNYNLTNFCAMKIINHVDFLQPIRLQLRDENGDKYDTQGSDWSMTLLFMDELS